MMHAGFANIAQLVEQRFRKPQVKGSSPFIGSTFYRGVAQFGSAFGSGPKGRRFKSCHLDHKKALQSNSLQGFFYTKNAVYHNKYHNQIHLIDFMNASMRSALACFMLSVE